MEEIGLSDYILKLRRNLVALSFLVLFYKYSGSTINGNNGDIDVFMFGIKFNSISINFLHKSVFFYLLYNLVYFSLSVICYLTTFFTKSRQNFARDMYNAPWESQQLKSDEYDPEGEFMEKIILRYDNVLKKAKLIRVIVIFSLIECLAPILTSVLALIFLY